MITSFGGQRSSLFQDAFKFYDSLLNNSGADVWNYCPMFRNFPVSAAPKGFNCNFNSASSRTNGSQLYNLNCSKSLHLKLCLQFSNCSGRSQPTARAYYGMGGKRFSVSSIYGASQTRSPPFSYPHFDLGRLASGISSCCPFNCV